MGRRHSHIESTRRGNRYNGNQSAYEGDYCRRSDRRTHLGSLLEHANIDYEVIDAYPIASPVGASIAIFLKRVHGVGPARNLSGSSLFGPPPQKTNIRLPSGKMVAGSPVGSLLEQR